MHFPPLPSFHQSRPLLPTPSCSPSPSFSPQISTCSLAACDTFTVYDTFSVFQANGHLPSSTLLPIMQAPKWSTRSFPHYQPPASSWSNIPAYNEPPSIPLVASFPRSSSHEFRLDEQSRTHAGVAHFSTGYPQQQHHDFVLHIASPQQPPVESIYPSRHSSVGSSTSSSSHPDTWTNATSWEHHNVNSLAPPLPMFREEPSCHQPRESYSSAPQHYLPTNPVLPSIDSLVFTPSGPSASPYDYPPVANYSTSTSFLTTPIDITPRTSAAPSYFEHPVSAPSTSAISSWAPTNSFPIMHYPLPPLASPSPYSFSAPNRGAEFTNRGREWDGLISGPAPEWSRADLVSSAWNDHADVVGRSGILARRKNSAKWTAPSEVEEALAYLPLDAGREATAMAAAAFAGEKRGVGRSRSTSRSRKSSSSSLYNGSTPISRLTGLPTKILAKRVWPPRDADKRHYLCSWEHCGKSCAFMVFVFLRSCFPPSRTCTDFARPLASVCRPSARDAHERTHSGARRKFSIPRCPFLPYSFHFPPPAFVCPIATCGRGFSVFSNLKRHMFVHPEVDFRGINSRDLSRLHSETSQAIYPLEPRQQPQFRHETPSDSPSSTHSSLSSAGQLNELEASAATSPCDSEIGAPGAGESSASILNATAWMALEDNFFPAPLAVTGSMMG